MKTITTTPLIVLVFNSEPRHINGCQLSDVKREYLIWLVKWKLSCHTVKNSSYASSISEMVTVSDTNTFTENNWCPFYTENYSLQPSPCSNIYATKEKNDYIHNKSKIKCACRY